MILHWHQPSHQRNHNGILRNAQFFSKMIPFWGLILKKFIQLKSQPNDVKFGFFGDLKIGGHLFFQFGADSHNGIGDLG